MTDKYLEQIPAGWFVRDVMRATQRGWDWCAFVIDCDPVDAPHHYSTGRKVQQGFYRIPGKYRSHAAACEALEGMRATRH